MKIFGSIVIFIQLCVLCMGKIGYDFYPELNGYLKVHAEPTDWRTARINCHNEAALLASPWTNEFSSTISRLQTTKYPSLPVLYSGAGIRAYSTGVPMEACDNKRCRVFHADGTMDKVHCSQKLPYACFAPKAGGCADDEWVGRDSSSSDETTLGIIPVEHHLQGFDLNSLTGECYKFHAEGASVPDAQRICSSEGGYLAYMSPGIETTVLQSMSDGLTFINNDNGGPAYRHLTNSGYSDYACTGPHAFICEMTPTTMVASDYRD